MIPDLGLMIGAYVVTRMILLLSRKDEQAGGALVKVTAVGTILIVIVCLVDLLTAGAQTSRAFEGLPPAP